MRGEGRGFNMNGRHLDSYRQNKTERRKGGKDRELDEERRAKIISYIQIYKDTSSWNDLFIMYKQINNDFN